MAKKSSAAPGAARYTVSMDARLLERFDKVIAKKGYANRSEAIRDLIRAMLVEEQWRDTSGKVAATVTLVYDHHNRQVGERLGDLQHHHTHLVVSATHVHLDNDNCLEVVILRGEAGRVRALADELIACKGVKHGRAVLTTEGSDIP
ncbi:MAG: nickel-responsive transcriptional regulator NikR [Candidatus Sumerlaeaceae bacterium]|nr:nickel-responsive transcriptional regulator NikR [Candidatus Sumerlaeaceae bacterium]